MADAHINFAYSLVTGTTHVGDGVNPGANSSTIALQAGDGSKFPNPPFNATVWPAGLQPLSSNAEIVRVTAINDDTLTLDNTSGTRNQQEGSSQRSILVGDQIAATITKKTLTDAEISLTYWSPLHIAGTNQTGFQTLGGTANIGTNSLFIFPVTIAPDLQFNQILIGNSLSVALNSTTSGTIANSSLYALYSLNGNTALSRISSYSFSIGETISNAKYTINFPSTTNTSGWGYSTSGVTTSAQVSQMVWGSRIVGLQFGGNFTNLTGGQYYLGILSLRNTTNVNSIGMSLGGLIGQPVISINQVSGSVVPIGVAASAWSGNNANQTQWWGRHILGLVTRTALYGGNAIPDTINITELGNTGSAGSTATILPAVTFVST